MDLTFTVQMLEVFLLVLMRMSAFIYSAPFFSQNTVPRKVKIGLSIALSIVVFNMVDYSTFKYGGMGEYALIMVKELLAGLLIGYMTNLCMMIVSFAGNLIDMEIGFSMATTMDPTTNVQTTITGNLYNMAIMLVMLISNMHLKLLEAMIDTFELIPVGKVNIPINIYEVMVEFIVDYFIVGFRIVMPVFLCILLVNVVLAILAKVAPQMNLFVIGLQLKVIVGLAILIVMAGLLGALTDFIFGEMTSVIQRLVIRMA